MFQYQLFCGHGYLEYTTIVRAEAVTKSGNPGITQIFNCNLNFLHKNKMPPRAFGILKNLVLTQVTPTYQARRNKLTHLKSYLHLLQVQKSSALRPYCFIFN